MIEPRRRIDRALWAVVMEAYVAGVSTRSVEDLVAALGRSPDRRCRASARASTRQEAVAWTTRFPYVTPPTSTQSGHGGLLAAHARPGPSRCAAGDLRRAPRAGGAGGGDRVRQGRSCPSVPGSRTRVATCSQWCPAATSTWPPRCSGPSSRSPTPTPSPPPGTKSETVAAGFPKAGPLMDAARTDVLAFSSFPRAHWRKIWSTNPLSTKRSSSSSTAIRLEPPAVRTVKSCTRHRDLHHVLSCPSFGTSTLRHYTSDHTRQVLEQSIGTRGVRHTTASDRCRPGTPTSPRYDWRDPSP